MPTTRASAAVAAPLVDAPPSRPAPVKRSQSLASLPTPPQTRHKRKRARSRVTDSDTDEDERLIVERDLTDDDAPRHDANGALIVGNKKRKTLDAIAEELSEAAKAEDAFWMSETTTTTNTAQDQPKAGPPPPRVHYRLRERSRTRSPSSSPAVAPHLLRRGHTGLASPPPSRRQPRTRVQARLPTPPPAPIPSRLRKPGLFPVRDSPNNPFLADEESATAPEAEAETEAGPSTPQSRAPERYVEKPTMTWVFRGTRVTLANPHYKPPGAEGETDAEAEGSSLLPPEHPEFSPPPTYAPKMLFPEARRDITRRRTRAQAAAERAAEQAATGSAAAESGAPPVAVPSTPPRKTPPIASRTRASSNASSRPVSTVSSRPEEPAAHDLRARRARPAKPSDAEVEAAMQAAMARRLARACPEPGSGEGPRTRTRAHGAPRLPEKDSDLVRRAMGPARVAAPTKRDSR